MPAAEGEATIGKRVTTAITPACEAGLSRSPTATGVGAAADETADDVDERPRATASTYASVQFMARRG
jgi:hypothetical protein